MKRLIVLIATVLTLSCQNEPYSVKMVNSEMQRHPDASYLDRQEGNLKWTYTPGLELLSFLDVYQHYGDEKILDYALDWYDRIIDSAGVIYKYKLSNYNIDLVCPARTLFYVYDKTGDEKYRKAMETIWSQLQEQPRTNEGGFWHKQIYPYQMWLDGLYMGEPFYAMYTSAYVPEQLRDSMYNDIVNQFVYVAKNTYDPQTKLYRHAYDESREMFWCDKTTGQSAHSWGRAMGWYVMAIVDVLDYIPEDFARRGELIELLRGIYDVLPDYADGKTGMWYQVLDSPGREGNYQEATCSSMFTYALLKGVRKGYLDASLESYAKTTYDNLVKTFIIENEDGTISLTSCCEVAGLGGKDNRSGTFEYYINEPVSNNDAKGVGPFIWASLEMERLDK